MINKLVVGIGINDADYVVQPTKSCKQSLGRGSEFLGNYGTPEEAHQAWLKRKRELSVELAAKQKDKRISDALLATKYEEF